MPKMVDHAERVRPGTCPICEGEAEATPPIYLGDVVAVYFKHCDHIWQHVYHASWDFVQFEKIEEIGYYDD